MGSHSIFDRGRYDPINPDDTVADFKDEQVAAREIDATERISDALLEILDDLGRWNKYVELFSKSEQVHKRAAHLFSHIVNFLVRAKSHYQSRRISKSL